MRLEIATPLDMEELGARLAARLGAGDVIALHGELGAGKTTFTRGLGAALGVRGAVTSPTFVLARTHPRPAGPPLVHVDAYRLSSAAEFDDLDIDVSGSIVVVEWAEGMLDGVTDSWLDIRIDRPRGAGVGAEVGVGPSAGRGPEDEVESDDDGVEPRVVTILGHGPRFADFRL